MQKGAFWIPFYADSGYLSVRLDILLDSNFFFWSPFLKQVQLYCYSFKCTNMHATNWFLTLQNKMKWYKLYNKILSPNILTQPNLIFKFSLILPRFIIKVFNNHKIMKIKSFRGLRYPEINSVSKAVYFTDSNDLRFGNNRLFFT